MLCRELLLLENVRLGIVLDCVDGQEAVFADGYILNAHVRVGVVKAGVNAAGAHVGLLVDAVWSDADGWRVVVWTVALWFAIGEELWFG